MYNVSGYPELVKKYGPEYSYQLAPRAKIFRRDESNVRMFMTSFMLKCGVYIRPSAHGMVGLALAAPTLVGRTCLLKELPETH